MKRHFESWHFELIYLQILAEIRYNYEYTPTCRGVHSFEITNLSFTLTNPLNNIVRNKARDMNLQYAKAFFEWMLSGKTDMAELIEINPYVKNFLNKGELPETFSTAYGPRLKEQLPEIVELFKNDRETRRAVFHILMNEDKQIFKTKTHVEYPCTDSLQFMIRDNKLHMYVKMRSNNVCKVICYDVYNFTEYHKYLWNLLREFYPELELGDYHHHCVSAHFYLGEKKIVDAILEEAKTTVVA